MLLLDLDEGGGPFSIGQLGCVSHRAMGQGHPSAKLVEECGG